MKAYLVIEMPKSCYDCDLAYQDDDSVYWTCAAIHRPACMQKRPDDCPLVPVPEHGDLIDRDALKAAICSRLCIESEKYLSPEEATIVNEIFAAPIILPAEEGE